MVTGGQMPGTAQLAATASVRETPLVRLNTVGLPLRALTATIRKGTSGHSVTGSREEMIARRSASGTVAAASAMRPSRAAASISSLTPSSTSAKNFLRAVMS